MKALVFDGTLSLRHNVSRPVRAAGEALIKVCMAGICQTDLEITRGYMSFHGIPGHEFVGVVEESDNPLLTGKRVVGEINCVCGTCENCSAGMYRHCSRRTVLGISGKDGAFAEYLVLPERNLCPVPDAVSNEEAVFVEPLAACFRILEQTAVKKDHTVLVLGDGRLGLLCSQVLQTAQCRVTLIGRHREKLSLVDGLGIKTGLIDDSIGQQLFDMSVDCTGSPDGIAFALQATKPQGTIVIKTTTAAPRGLDLNSVVVNEIRLLGSRCGPFPPALRALEQKKIRVAPLISHIIDFDKALAGFRAATQKGALKILFKM
jgi:threonine dehydrogenase-like Zn-dependent dehydrogenase